MTKKIETEDGYQPVAFDSKAYVAKKRKADPAFRAAYDALEDEFVALAARLSAKSFPRRRESKGVASIRHHPGQESYA